MQLQLFAMEADKRMDNMRDFIRAKLFNNSFWFPTTRQIIDIGDKFGVTGSKPLITLEREIEKYIDYLEVNSTLDEEYDLYGNADEETIRFYKNKLKNAKKRI